MSVILPLPPNLYEAVRPNTLADVVGNRPIVQMLRNLLVRDAVKPGFIITGNFGNGKTSMARIIARSIVCENRQIRGPCGECPSCAYSPTIVSSWGKGITVRNCGHYTIKELRSDFREDLYAHDRPLVLVLDEFQRAAAEVKLHDLLLTLLEDDLNMAVLVITADQSCIDEALAQRLITLEMKPPTTDEAMAFLKKVRDQFGYRVADDKLREICSAAGNVLRACLNLLQVADAEEDS